MIASSAMRGRQFFFGGEEDFFDPKAVNAHSLQPAQKVNADCAHTEGNEGEGRRTVSVSRSLSLSRHVSWAVAAVTCLSNVESQLPGHDRRRSGAKIRAA